MRARGYATVQMDIPNRQADRQVGGQYLGAGSQSLSHVVVNSHSQSRSKGFIRGDTQQDKSVLSVVS